MKGAIVYPEGLPNVTIKGDTVVLVIGLKRVQFEPISGAFNDSESMKIERPCQARIITACQKQ